MFCRLVYGALNGEWPTKEEDKKIIDLSNMVHSLTKELIDPNRSAD